MSASGPPLAPAELSARAIALGAALSALLAAANAYLGLFAGLTVSASIPAAVMSMAILRGFGGGILENNVVQTAASAGEAVAAGAIFTLPALVLMGVWSGFSYLETTLITGLGGVLGVLFTVPLRRALIVNTPLEFPEGVATAEVLRAGQGGGGLRAIAFAGAVGALFKLGETGLRLWTGVAEGARHAFGTVLYFGSNLSPALLAVGYIVGLEVSVLVFLGGAVNWLVIIPAMLSSSGVPEGVGALAAAEALWSEQTRYLGVGAMVVGGLWALVSLRGPLADGVRAGLDAYRAVKRGGPQPEAARTEQDLPMAAVLTALALSVVPLFALFWHLTGVLWVSAIMAVLMLVAGFLFSAVAGYMAGLVGSSNNPISGVTIATILTSALLLLGMLGRDSPIGPAAAILIGSVVACAAAIAGDNMQDLKAGRIVGATPRAQQVMQNVGVVAAALVMAPVLGLLLEAYGIGGDPTAAHPHPLSAPQATLMASVATGVFSGDLPWTMVGAGAALATGIIALDVYLERRGASFRTPVLAVAVGIYLPLSLSVPILIGGVLAKLAARARRGRPGRQGLLFAAGLITGEALMGILLAGPIVAFGDPEVLAIFGAQDVAWPGALLLVGVVLLVFRMGARADEA